MRIFLLILLVAFAACKSAVQPTRDTLPPPLPSGAAVDASAGDPITATLANGWIQVTLAVPQTGAGPFPAVISPILPDEELLERGFAVVRFHTNWETLRGLARPDDAGAKPHRKADAPADTSPPPAPEPTDPPESVGKWILTAPRPGIIGRAYFDIITMDAESTVPKVVDWLETRPEIDATRIAITGSSTSGFVALQAMAAEPRIALGVVRVACGDYLKCLRSSSLALNDDPRWLPDGKLVLDPDYAVEIATREPIRHADRYPPRPLLLLAGERDQAIPYECVENTVQRFTKAYRAVGADDRFRFVSYAQGGHVLSADANAEILPWLERWLAPGVTASAR